MTFPAASPAPGLRSDRGAAGRRAALLALIVIALLAVTAAGSLVGKLRGSRPRLDGEIVIPGLVRPIEITRDARGLPAIAAASRRDAALALGFLHGQERFFQIDLLRRSAAGELAALVGAAALPKDEQVRPHRFRARARRALGDLSRDDRSLLNAYAAGVNAGLAYLDAVPFEYLVLRQRPAPWLPEDSLLVVYAMYVELQDERAWRDRTLAVLRERLPPAVYAWLATRGTDWDAPVAGPPLPTPPVPRPEQAAPAGAAQRRPRVRPTGRALSLAGLETAEPVEAAGSNAWVLSGSRTADGRALLANDMHLPLRVPNIWYAATATWPDAAAPGGTRRMTGVTLPGLPAWIAGSNGQIAWGFTNAYADTSDAVPVVPDPSAPDTHYRTPDGSRRFRFIEERIESAGGEPVMRLVRETEQGPVFEDRLSPGRPLAAVRWVAHLPGAVDFGLLRLERAPDVATALDLAAAAGMPAQNFLVADDAGQIGWTIAGALPARPPGCDGSLPEPTTSERCAFRGLRPPEEHPRLVDPPGGAIWSANARMVGGAALARLGDGGYALGARARQIRDRLAAVDSATERDMLEIQLDDEALFLARWRDLLLDLLDGEALAADPRRRELRDLAEHWGGRASIDSAGYRCVRAFRTLAGRRLFRALLDRYGVPAEVVYFGRFPQAEGPLWQLVTERPPHFLPAGERDWRAFLLGTADEVIRLLTAGGRRLAERTWGERNRTQIRHPLSQALPWLARWLDMPRHPLPGDGHMPRVQAPAAGASERIVVAPGAEARALLEMPAGESGHPLSEHYRNLHEAWERGEPTPLLPGEPAHRLVLAPGG